MRGFASPSHFSQIHPLSYGVNDDKYGRHVNWCDNPGCTNAVGEEKFGKRVMLLVDST